VSGPVRARLAAGFVVTAVAVALAGCASVVRMAYNNGDIAVRMMANEYLDLQGNQAELFKVRLARLHEWHRLEELPRYAEAFDSAAARVTRGATREDVEWAVVTVSARYRALAGQAVDESIPVLVTLTPGNFTALEKKFEASNRKFTREHIDGAPAEREAARIEAISDRFEEWLGSVSAAQQRLIAEYVRAQPANQALRLADRKTRQRELLEILRWERDPAVMREKLHAFFVDYEARRDPAFVRASRQWQERVVTLVADILAVASPAQREYAAARLKRYAEDCRALADEGRGKLPPGTRAAETATQPGA